MRSYAHSRPSPRATSLQFVLYRDFRRATCLEPRVRRPVGRSPSRVGGSVKGRLIGPQYASDETTSPLAMVPIAHHVSLVIDDLMNLTEPSHNRTLTPLGC